MNRTVVIVDRVTIPQNCAFELNEKTRVEIFPHTWVSITLQELMRWGIKRKEGIFIGQHMVYFPSRNITVQLGTAKGAIKMTCQELLEKIVKHEVMRSQKLKPLIDVIKEELKLIENQD